jgi:hypothetical protein
MGNFGCWFGLGAANYAEILGAMGDLVIHDARDRNRERTS